MDLKYAMKLAKAYETFHDSLAKNCNQLGDWPVCADPAQRHKEFLEFLDTLPEDDAWVQYYKAISIHIESLVWMKKPKDTTRP